MLQDFIVNAYRPGDTVQVWMSQPSSFCIGHQDLVSFFFFLRVWLCEWFTTEVLGVPNVVGVSYKRDVHWYTYGAMEDGGWMG
jgi:hypothetical protein